ncbi:MAG: hypothetical protein A2428_03680 [Bdellovibrionales bacterium RIFOXYC1_FULL_54_43]|nr:MAG: hypothetical protein A2428_03680 [Bdellovibrionales bacterium RIFOXYC1_FULL_54_43]OFZ83812.1 MAG: hypothetical protein A2603_11105 [Bdellovibrionales bacterium RIFOXYD1_FULL_55_31]
MVVRKTILVIESDHETRVSIRRALEDAGHFVISATNGADALSLLEKMSLPSIILLDASIPLMNGEQFLAVLRSDPERSSIPVVQISGPGEARLEGAFCSITKPLTSAAILKVVENCK